MDDHADTLHLEYEPATGRKLKVTARWRDDAVHIDTFDVNIASRRAKFARSLQQRFPQADLNEINKELLKIADSLSSAPEITGQDGDELSLSKLVRPEQFITADVCGLVLPVTTLVNGKPAAQWTLYLRWPDGRRERRGLSETIELPTGSRLWLHPIPGGPSVTTAPAWSVEARREWLSGKAVPNSANLFQRLCERIAYFIDFPKGIAAGTTATLALWCLLSYIYQAFEAVPYLYLGGPLGSGKSRVFEVLSRLAFRPLQSSSITGPALFRTLHDRGGVVLYDEAERLRQSTPETEDILSMLLAGYKRGGQATRLEPVGDTFKIKTFDVFGPKALACVAGLPPALASRCITVLMFRAGPGSYKPKRRIDEDRAGWQSLRDDLHALTLEHGPTWLKLASRSEVCPNGISGRGYELWQPLLALAEWVEANGAKGLLGLLQQHALASIDSALDEQVPEADEIVLEILTEAILRGQPPTPGEILALAKERASNLFDRWQAQTVTRRLKTYGIAKPRKSNGSRKYRHVTTEALLHIERNYGIDLNLEDHAPTPESSTLVDPVAPPARLKTAGGSVGRVDEGQ